MININHYVYEANEMLLLAYANLYLPEDKIEDLSYVKDVLKKNKEYSVKNRNQIRDYGIKTFGLANILEFEYVPKLQSLL
jgi:hypothetical protein